MLSGMRITPTFFRRALRVTYVSAQDRVWCRWAHAPDSGQRTPANTITTRASQGGPSGTTVPPGVPETFSVVTPGVGATGISRESRDAARILQCTGRPQMSTVSRVRTPRGGENR